MTTEHKRTPLTARSTQPGVRGEAATSRTVAEHHVDAVQKALALPSDDAEAQTAKNLRARDTTLEATGIVLAFCAEQPPGPSELSERDLSQIWPTASERALDLGAQSAQALGIAPPSHVVVHGETHTAHVRLVDGDARVCLVEVERAPSDAAIVARLENMKCAH